MTPQFFLIQYHNSRRAISLVSRKKKELSIEILHYNEYVLSTVVENGKKSRERVFHLILDRQYECPKFRIDIGSVSRNFNVFYRIDDISMLNLEHKYGSHRILAQDNSILKAQVKYGIYRDFVKDIKNVKD